MNDKQTFPAVSSVGGASPPAKQLVCIDAARGIAALAVTLYHANQWILWSGIGVDVFSGGYHGFSSQSFAYWTTYLAFGFGFLGVQLFFVLSGFCIHLPNANVGSVEWKQFAIRRIFRIYPCYLLLVVIAFLAQAHSRGAALGPDPWMNFVCHLFFWHYADGGATAGMGISPVLWTLTLEVHFYILYVVCFPWLRRWGVGRLAIVWLLADLAYHVVYVVWLADLGWGDFWAPSRFSPLRFGEWLVGAYLAERYTQGRPSLKYALPVGIGLLVAAIFAGTLLSLDRYTATNIPATVAFFLILQHYVGNEKHGLARGRLSILRLLGSVGAFSYSLYLFHAVVIPVIRRILIAFSGGFTRYAVFLIAVACSIGAAYVVYIIIEKPSHELGRKMAARFRPRLKGHDGV